mmetsp:Transcript_32504/g.107133  ORF Transcript_32504/g.107133 Transcript_32504/m.107133 type:complete len:240 (+) Transcript_32504:338-1057(+)
MFSEDSFILIEDFGNVMTNNDLIANTCTHTKASANEIVEAMVSGDSISMMGKFGVGQSSGYFVANKISVATKLHDDMQYIWESGSGGSYTVQRDVDMQYGEIQHGTKIVCHLKKDLTELMDDGRVLVLAMKYSELAKVPVELHVTLTENDTTDSEGDSKVKIEEIKHVEIEEFDQTNKYNNTVYEGWGDGWAVRHSGEGGQLEFRALRHSSRRAPLHSWRRRSGAMASRGDNMSFAPLV